MVNKYQIVIFSSISWEFLWQRPQAIALELARQGIEVVYIEPLTTLLKEQSLAEASRSIERRQIEKDLILLSLPTGIPSFKGRPKWLLEGKFRLALAKLKEQLSSKDQVLIFNNPSNWERLLKYSKLDPRLVIYDCLDDHVALESDRASSARIAEEESDLIEKADLIFVSAKALSRKLGGRAARYIPNAVDREIIDAPHLPTVKLDHIPKPRIGFLGAIWPWVDIDLIMQASVMYQNASFILIGPVKDMDITALKAQSNVYFVPPIEREQIPSYLDALDVAINPFVESTLLETVSPVKVYAYLARGLPVVSTKMPELSSIEHVIHSAASPNEFLRLIEVALSEARDEGWKKMRREAARQNTWTDRAAIMRTVIETRLAQKEDSDA